MKNHKLWQQTINNNSLVEDFTSGDDLLIDTYLIPYDIYGSLAHAQMLSQVKLITSQEWAQIQKALLSLKKEYEVGTLRLQAGDEDVHTRIENEVTELYPEAGADMHIGRSRNDQILTDLRLFTKDELFKTAQLLLGLIKKFKAQAEANSLVPMPGYTHLQPAMLSSVGLWLAQFAESLDDDLAMVQLALEMNDQSPLGSGAAYGVSLPIDRELTAESLGFAKIQNNSLYCQNSRGKIESLTVHSLGQVMHTLGRFASDLLLFTTAEFNFFDLPDELTTGSSIMPQKKNFDLLELLRAKEKTMLAYEFQIASTISGLSSGYNRDLQEIKKPYVTAFELLQKSLAITTLVLDSLVIKSDEIKHHIYPEMFAAHWAYQIMKSEHLPFRQAYFKVKQNLQTIPNFDIEKVLAETNSQGAPGNLRLDILEKNLATQTKYWEAKQHHFDQQLSKLTATI